MGEDFTAQELTTLAGWYKHFTTKYPVVGTLKEYDDWDFSAVYKEAETQTPFGAGKSDTDADGNPNADSADAATQDDTTAVAAAASETSASLPENAVVLRKNMRVVIKGVQGREELNGSCGILEDYVADKGRFVVKLESNGEKVLMKPANL